jgi:hypothetical protein
MPNTINPKHVCGLEQIGIGRKVGIGRKEGASNCLEKA